MNCKAVFCFTIVFLMLTGCAAMEDPMSTRPPKKLITQDDYVDLKIKPCEEESLQVDYKKEGIYAPSINTKM